MLGCRDKFHASVMIQIHDTVIPGILLIRLQQPVHFGQYQIDLHLLIVGKRLPFLFQSFFFFLFLPFSFSLFPNFPFLLF